MSAAVQMTLNTTYQGKEPEVLADLIQKRMRILGEDAKDATIATAMNVLVSLRSQTKVADPTKAEFEMRYASEAEAVWRKSGTQTTSTTAGRGIHRRCIKAGGSLITNFVNLAPKYIPGETIKVYHYRPLIRTGKDTAIKQEGRYIVARSEKDAYAWATKNASARLKRYSGMAKSAWGHTMRMIGSQTSAQEGEITSQARKVVMDNIKVDQRGGNLDFAVSIFNELEYAENALANGSASVTLAMQNASNKTAGILKKRIAELGYLSVGHEPVETPFPETVRRRK